MNIDLRESRMAGEDPTLALVQFAATSCGETGETDAK